jgi:hypothetical protein
MSKRGRKPPKHDPLVCAGCGSAPVVRDGVLQPCSCGQAWNLELVRDRLPKWAEQLKEN